MTLEARLDTTREQLPPGHRYVLGGAIFQQPEDTINEPLPQLLLLKRAESDSFPGYWEIPGGKMKPGETIREAVYREIFEETGLTVQFVLKELVTVRWVDDQSGDQWVQMGFLVTVEQSADVRLDPEEHSDRTRRSRDEVDELPHLPGQAKLWEAAFSAQAELAASVTGL